MVVQKCNAYLSRKWSAPSVKTKRHAQCHNGIGLGLRRQYNYVIVGNTKRGRHVPHFYQLHGSVIGGLLLRHVCENLCDCI